MSILFWFFLSEAVASASCYGWQGQLVEQKRVVLHAGVGPIPVSKGLPVCGREAVDVAGKHPSPLGLDPSKERDQVGLLRKASHGGMPAEALLGEGGSGAGKADEEVRSRPAVVGRMGGQVAMGSPPGKLLPQVLQVGVGREARTAIALGTGSGFGWGVRV